jgi:hypothetical protein
MRQQVKIVMRYAGPRMLLHHPFLACMHLIDGRRKAPGLTGRIKKNYQRLYSENPTGEKRAPFRKAIVMARCIFWETPWIFILFSSSSVMPPRC